MSEKLITYLRGIADWADPNPAISRDMLIHEMGRIRRQALACIRIIEQPSEVAGDGGSSCDTAETPGADESA